MDLCFHCFLKEVQKNGNAKELCLCLPLLLPLLFTSSDLNHNRVVRCHHHHHTDNIIMVPSTPYQQHHHMLKQHPYQRRKASEVEVVRIGSLEG